MELNVSINLTENSYLYSPGIRFHFQTNLNLYKSGDIYVITEKEDVETWEELTGKTLTLIGRVFETPQSLKDKGVRVKRLLVQIKYRKELDEKYSVGNISCKEEEKDTSTFGLQRTISEIFEKAVKLD